jgi:hypothetical protein
VLPKLDPTWVPFLDAVAREDKGLRARATEDGVVAFFPTRKLAAEVVARLTGRPATYVAFRGETRDSSSAPTKPYRKQNLLIAQFLLDQIQAAGFLGRPRTDSAWRKQGYYDQLTTRLLKDGYGPELKQEILDESRRRKQFAPLKDAGFERWRESKQSSSRMRSPSRSRAGRSGSEAAAFSVRRRPGTTVRGRP